jgi:hypothetical protein
MALALLEVAVVLVSKVHHLPLHMVALALADRQAPDTSLAAVGAAHMPAAPEEQAGMGAAQMVLQMTQLRPMLLQIVEAVEVGVEL